jgi:hypothetical protein
VERAWVELDLGRLEEGAGDYKKALTRYRNGLILVQEKAVAGLEPALHNGEGVCLIRLEEWDLAEATLREAVALRRKEVEKGNNDAAYGLSTSLYNLGMVAAHQQRWQEVRSLLEESAALSDPPEHLLTLVDLARILQQGGQTAAALEVLDAFAGLASQKPDAASPELLADQAYVLGLTLGDARRTLEALDVLKAAAEAYAELNMTLESGLAWYNRGTTAQRAGATAVAEDAFLNALDAARRIGDNDSVRTIETRLEQLRGENP